MNPELADDRAHWFVVELDDATLFQLFAVSAIFMVENGVQNQGGQSTYSHGV